MLRMKTQRKPKHFRTSKHVNKPKNFRKTKKRWRAKDRTFTSTQKLPRAWFWLFPSINLATNSQTS